MDFLAIQKALETELNSYWGSTTPIFWENTQMNTDDIQGLYIAPEVVPNLNDKIAYGNCRTVNSIGLFTIRVVGNFGEGTGAVIEKASLLNNHFSDKAFSKVHTETGNIQKIGVVDNRYQVSVIIPYNSYQN